MLLCRRAAATSGGFNAPLLGTLAHGSGGEVAIHLGFGPLLGQALGASLGRRIGAAGTLDCFCSEGLRLVQWIGPVDVLKVGASTTRGEGGGEQGCGQQGGGPPGIGPVDVFKVGATHRWGGRGRG